jgi:peptidoglycan/LPS O-acetylase OafA/YrhL
VTQEATVVATVTPRRRNATLDGLRYVAAAALVLHHVSAHEGGSNVGAFLVASMATALFFFFAVSGYLHGAVGGRGWAWRWRRFTRLAVPYALWSVVYLAVGQRALLHGGAPYLPNPLTVIFFAGAHGILWFLPMLLVCALLTDILVRSSRSRVIAIVVCIIAIVVLYVVGTTSIPTSMLNFALAPRYLLVYLGGMEVRARAPVARRGSAIVGVAVGCIVAVGVLRVTGGGLPLPVSATLETALWIVGALAVLLGAVSGMRWFGAARLAWGREYFLGIYVTHVLWLGAFFTVLPPDRWPPAIWILVCWAFCFAGASLTTFALRSFRLTRPMVV